MISNPLGVKISEYKVQRGRRKLIPNDAFVAHGSESPQSDTEEYATELLTGPSELTMATAEGEVNHQANQKPYHKAYPGDDG